MPKSLLQALIVLLICTVITIPQPNLAKNITCACNECETDNCTITHEQSQCMKSFQLVLENNTLVLTEPRFGCINGEDGRIDGLQCSVDNTNHREPVFIACCNGHDLCNEELADPEQIDDPRLIKYFDRINNPKQPVPYLDLSIIGAVIIFSVLFICLSVYVYIKVRRKKQLKAGSQNSIYDSNFVERLKIHAAEKNNSPPSTHTYTISDISSHKSDSPCEQSCGSIEHTSTLPDLTSGAGTRVIEERTIARYIGSKAMLPVGSGRHGRVYVGEYHYNKVAVKAFRSIDADSWKREETILRKIHHENIIRWIASETVSVDDFTTETWMIIEYCPYGSLCDFLDHYEIQDPAQAVKIVHSIIQGINYLHEDLQKAGGKPSIAHRDIKSRNILMRTPEVCCIADFGHAVVKVDESTIDFGGNNRIQVGTVRYMAPEILQPEDLDVTQFDTFAQSDLYQFALVLWEVAQRTRMDEEHPAGPHQLPYDGVVTQNPDLEDMIKIVCEVRYRPPVYAHWQQNPIMQQLASLMVECWLHKPKARMETLAVMKRILDLLEGLKPQHMYNQAFYNNIIDNFSPNFRLDKDQLRSSTGEKTQTTLNMSFS